MKNLNESITVAGKLPAQDTRNISSQKANKSLIGLGYPLKPNPVKGIFSKVTNIEAAKSALHQLLRTQPGERVMLPDFGCSLKTFLFNPFDSDTVEDIREVIVKSVNKYLPFIKILKLKITPLNNYSTALPTIKISLWCQLREEVNSTFELGVVV